MCRCEGELSNFDEILTAEIKEKKGEPQSFK